MINIALYNGRYAPELSDERALPAGAMINEQEGVLTLTLNDNCQIKQPIKFIYQNDAHINEIQLQHNIIMGAQSSLTLLDEFAGEIVDTHYHIATHITQKKDSSLSLVCLKNGAKLAQNNIHVVLAESGAECKTAGFYHLEQDNQECHYHLTIEHAAAHTQSDMLFKGIADKKSRASFIGRLHVHPHAQKINAQQANHHLLLSQQAETSSRPELEIYADDVRCKHGATTGQLDQDALFYLRARGIQEDEAKKMLIAGFAEEVLQRVAWQFEGGISL